MTVYITTYSITSPEISKNLIKFLIIIKYFIIKEKIKYFKNYNL